MSIEKRFFSFLLNRITVFFDGLALFLFVVLIILATLQILFRYVFMYPLPWTEELARFTLVWVTFLGAASATRRKLHLAVDFFINRLNPRVAKFITFFFLYFDFGVFNRHFVWRHSNDGRSQAHLCWINNWIKHDVFIFRTGYWPNFNDYFCGR